MCGRCEFLRYLPIHYFGVLVKRKWCLQYSRTSQMAQPSGLHCFPLLFSSIQALRHPLRHLHLRASPYSYCNLRLYNGEVGLIKINVITRICIMTSFHLPCSCEWPWSCEWAFSTSSAFNNVSKNNMFTA